MILFFSKRFNSKKGFTLVELLVVIAILGLLALIAIPRLGAYRKDAAEAANKASAASIYNGAQAYLAKHTTLVGFNWEDYTTGAMPSDAVVSPVTEDGYGGISPVTVASNGGLWIGIFPEGGSAGGPGGGSAQEALKALLPGAITSITGNRTINAPSVSGADVSFYSNTSASGWWTTTNWDTSNPISITINRRLGIQPRNHTITVRIVQGAVTAYQDYNVFLPNADSTDVVVTKGTAQQALLILLPNATVYYSSNTYISGFRIYNTGRRLIETGSISGAQLTMTNFANGSTDWESTGATSALPRRREMTTQMTVTITREGVSANQVYNVVVSSVVSSQVYLNKAN